MTPSTEQPDGCLPQDAFASMAPIFQVVMEKKLGLLPATPLLV